MSSGENRPAVVVGFLIRLLWGTLLLTTAAVAVGGEAPRVRPPSQANEGDGWAQPCAEARARRAPAAPVRLAVVIARSKIHLVDKVVDARNGITTRVPVETSLGVEVIVDVTPVWCESGVRGVRYDAWWKRTQPSREAGVINTSGVSGTMVLPREKGKVVSWPFWFFTGDDEQVNPRYLLRMSVQD